MSIKDCQSFDVFPKYICFPVPNVNQYDVHAMRKRLLRSAIAKRSKQKRKLEDALEIKSSTIKETFNTIEKAIIYILNKALTKNVDKKINNLRHNHNKNYDGPKVLFYRR